MFDPEFYRTKGEVEEWKQRDPIPALIAAMRAASAIGDQDIAAIEKEVSAEVDDCIAFADAGTPEPVSDLTRFVYSRH
jgi:TPP-dependent pyruvate/acetoin dehydrogenase alpha subunit